MQNIREMIIHVSINNSLFILYFPLNLDAKFEQYREHYAQIHEIVSNESNSAKVLSYKASMYCSILMCWVSQAAIQKQDCGITWCGYSHVMWLRWLCIERDNFEFEHLNIYRESFILE